jgi:uncharacterized protein (TIGR00269 family)
MHLCREHFIESVRKRVLSDFHNQVHLRGGEKVAVAYSGGKDSSLTLHLMKEILEPMRGVTLTAIIVDEGIAGYRDIGIPVAREFCQSHDVELIETRMKDAFGITLDEISKKNRAQSTCTYCGVLRRKMMNKVAREIRADYLATGLNLDDTAQGIVMNIFRGDVEKLARMGPHDSIQGGLVPRIQPLRKIPEKESLLFCLQEGLRFHDRECPYSHEAARNLFREMIAKMEEEFPGTRHSILSSYDSIRGALRDSYPPAQLNLCSCGEPTMNEKCKSCQLLEGLGIVARQ